MFSVKKPKKPLSELEHLVMQLVWSQGPISSDAVRETLAPTKPMKESTVRTILRRLEAKGYVEHKLDGRTYIYQPKHAATNVAVSAVRQIIERFCGGSVEQLLTGMVDEEVVDRAELKKLAEKIARRKEK